MAPLSRLLNIVRYRHARHFVLLSVVELYSRVLAPTDEELLLRYWHQNCAFPVGIAKPQSHALPPDLIFVLGFNFAFAVRGSELEPLAGIIRAGQRVQRGIGKSYRFR